VNDLTDRSTVETPTQTRLRWLDALEQLSRREAAQLRAGDFAGARQSRQQAEPLLTSLIGIAGTEDTLVRARTAAVLAIRQRTHEWLTNELTMTRSALERVGSVQRRLEQVAPAYRSPDDGTPSQFCAQG
jgi:hypothetical protein